MKSWPAPCRVVPWDAETIGQWAAEFEGADVVVGLAGRNVNCRYTPENRRLIMDSRVKSTHVVGAAIAQAARPPRLWLQASTATIYAHRFDQANDETTGIIGGQEPNAPDTWRFSIEVAKAWESATMEAALPQAEFMRVLRAAWGTPIGLPATAWMAATGAFALGTETELILKSRRVVPGRLSAAGFDFQFSSWPAAARDLCARWKNSVP